MLLVLTRVLRPLEIIELIIFHLESKAEPTLVSLVTSEIILFLATAILVKGFIKVFYIEIKNILDPS